MNPNSPPNPGGNFYRNLIVSTLAATAIAFGVSEMSESNSDDRCDAKLTNPASWVVCPIVDFGGALNDKVFDGLSDGLESKPQTPNR